MVQLMQLTKSPPCGRTRREDQCGAVAAVPTALVSDALVSSGAAVTNLMPSLGVKCYALIADTIQRPSWSFVMEQSDARTADGNGPLPSNVRGHHDSRRPAVKRRSEGKPTVTTRSTRTPQAGGLGNARATGGAAG